MSSSLHRAHTAPKKKFIKGVWQDTVVVEMQAHKFEARIELLSYLRGRQYTVTMACPHCGHGIGMNELKNGWVLGKSASQLCFACEREFAIKVECDGLPYDLMEPSHVVADLGKLVVLFEADIRQLHSQLYHSALVHYLSLRAAFRQSTTFYYLSEKIGEDKKIDAFFGRVSDKCIADALSVGKDRIGKSRRSMNRTGRR